MVILKQLESSSTFFHCNAVMIVVDSCYLTSKVVAAAPILSSESSDCTGPKGDETVVEPDDVYYRFGGAAIEDPYLSHGEEEWCSLRNNCD